MKILKHLLAGVLTIALFTIHSPVKAGDHRDGSLYGGASAKWRDYNNGDDKKTPAGGGSGSSGSTNLPINDYVWALGIFATALGAKIITDKVKFAKD